MSMRVLQIIPTLDQGGAEKQLAMLAGGLAAGVNGDPFDVHVCALTRSGPLADSLEQQGITIHQVRKRWKLDPAAYWRLKRIIRRLQPDVVHTWLFAANSYGRQAALAAGVKHVVAGERCVDLWKRWHELAIDRHLARRTDRVATNSQGVANFYTQKGIPAEKFVVIPNGIAAREQPVSRRSELLSELGLPQDSRLIGAVGRLWPQKRYKDLVWASELLKCVRDDTHLLIVGEGPQRWRLERYIRQVEIGDRVHLLGHRSDVPDILAALDCFWLASGYEGQSNALMEAMLVGVPVVVSDIPGNRELVLDRECGLVVPVGDRAAYAQRTQQLLEDPQWARDLGLAARRRMLDEFSVTSMVQRHAELYRELKK